MPMKLPYKMYDINDQVKIVQSWWDNIDCDSKSVVKPIKEVAKKLVEKKLFIEPSSA